MMVLIGFTDEDGELFAPSAEHHRRPPYPKSLQTQICGMSLTEYQMMDAGEQKNGPVLSSSVLFREETPTRVQHQ